MEEDRKVFVIIGMVGIILIILSLIVSFYFCLKDYVFSFIPGIDTSFKGNFWLCYAYNMFSGILTTIVLLIVLFIFLSRNERPQHSSIV